MNAQGSCVMLMYLMCIIPAFHSFFPRHTLCKSTRHGSPYAVKSVNFVAAMRKPKLRKQVIDELLNLKADSLTALNPWEVKTALAMCVDSMSDTLIRNFVRKLQAAGMVTSELLCITLRLACKKQWSGAVYFVLKTTKEGKFTTDLDGINSALEVFLHNKDTALAIDLLNSVQKGSFGPDVRCDWSTFGLLLMTTSRQADSIAFQRVHDFIAQNLSALPPSTNDQIFINALQRSVLRQELSIAQNVFALYKMFHGIVETRAYALLLTAYLDTAISTTKNTTSYIIEDRKHTEQQLCQLVNYILQSNLDNDPLIGDLVLRYHCSQQDLSSAYHYLTQRWSSSSAEMIPVVPSTVALHAYSDLVCADENVAHATILHQYCAKHDLQPFVEVNRYSLLRPDLASLPVKWIAFLAERATRGSTLKTLHLADAEAARLICDRVWHAVSLALDDTSQRDSPTGAYADMTTLAQALHCAQLYGKYAGSFDLIVKLCGVFQAIWSDQRQLKEQHKTAMGEDVAVLREVIEGWIELHMRSGAVSKNPGNISVVESYLAPVQLYFSLVPSPPPQSTLSPQEVAEQGMLLLAKQALLAGYDDLYATLRDILHSAPATRSFLPWLDVASLLLTGQGESAQRLHIEVGAPQGAGCETPRREIRDPPTFFYNWFSKLLSK